MASLPRPLIALLVGTLAFFALWITALKPSSSSSGGNTSTRGLGAYQSAINKAHQAVGTANAAGAAEGGAVPTTPAKTSTAPAAGQGSAAAGARANSASKASSAQASGAAGANAVDRAIASHKVVAVLFFNPAAADDQAVKQELSAVSTSGGQVAKFSVPLSQLASYTAITSQVSVNSSPTMVVINRHQQASTIVGFADGLEISQRIADALAGH